MIKLDVGCGAYKKEGYQGVDSRFIENVDYPVDIENQKLPFDNDSVDEIYTNHTLEHIDNIIFVMNEFFRVLKWGGNLKVIVPDYKCTLAWQDPTHKRYWTDESMKYFCGEYLKKYSLDYGIQCCFKINSIEKFVPEDKDPEYITELHFDLSKDKAWADEINYPILNERKEENFDPTSEITIKLQLMLDVFKSKNASYGNAFFDEERFGDEDIFHNLHRKWIELDTYRKSEKPFSQMNDKTLTNTFLDLSLYCIMSLVKIEKERGYKIVNPDYLI